MISVDGVLNVDKPAGITSHDVVGRVRRALRTKRVGHAGTLDPDATGVLVVAVGPSTRLLPFLPTEPKVYVARIRFGRATDTEDASGRVVAEEDASRLTADMLDIAIPRFLGEIEQVPPMVSAVHHEGRRLYELAREGIVVEREPRRVTIHALELSDFCPGNCAEATLRIVCGGGTYIRTLCADLGKAVRLPAHMAALRREAVGAFTAAEALPLDRIVGPVGEAAALAALMPSRSVLNLPFVELSDIDAVRIVRGQSIICPPDLEEFAVDQPIALLNRERLGALAHLKERLLFPFRVFPEAFAADDADLVA